MSFVEPFLKSEVHVLVVDDEEPIRTVYRDAIRLAGFQSTAAGSAAEALGILKNIHADVVITDIRMPDMNGIELMGRIREKYDTDIIVMTGYAEDYTYEKIIALGAKDFIHKPVNLGELLARLKRVTHERALVKQRNQAFTELKDAYIDTVNRLVIASEYKDEDTGDHIVRISKYCSFIAKWMNMPSDFVETIMYASPMHDVGKIGIPDKILLKPGKLDPDEFEIMKNHTIIGAKILAHSKPAIIRMACDIALTHHERWDGCGYPKGLAGKSIPICGRIVAVADTFDALTSARPYKKPYPPQVAAEIIKNERGKQFDPEIADVFLDHLDEMITLRGSVGEMASLEITDFEWSERDLAVGTNITMASLFGDKGDGSL